MTAAGEGRPVRLSRDDPAFEVPGGIPDPAPDVLGDLEFLEHHWGTAYVFRAEGTRYTADRRDGKGVTLTAADRDGMMGKIEADYAADPVPRELAAAGTPGAGEDDALDALETAWGDRYDEFWVDGGEWSAHREGAAEGDVVTAASPDELDREIRAREAAR